MRRAPAQKKKVDPDPVFRSVLVSQVINKVLLKGKKDLARTIVYDALETVEQRTSQDPTVVLKRAVDNIRPQVEVRSRRVGGSSYQVPVEVSPRRQNSLAIRWLVGYARRRREATTDLPERSRQAGRKPPSPNRRTGNVHNRIASRSSRRQ